MKQTLCLWTCFIFLSAGSCLAADVPRQIGPFILGEDISGFASYVDMRSELPIRYVENIKEVEITPIKGFKSGLIAYGSCKFPGKILRIKLKYNDNSKAFFNTLHKRIESRFGKFEEYRGDPFQVVVGWKKSFKDSQGNRISLTIQHNNRDEEEKMGNSIKLTLTNLWDADCTCHNLQSPDKPKAPVEIPVQQQWDLFVPR